MGAKVKIVGNGSVRDTRVFLEDGTEIKHVRSVKFQHEVGELPLVQLELLQSNMEMVGYIDELERKILPPPLPKPTLLLRIVALDVSGYDESGSPAFSCGYKIERVTPLHDTGAVVEVLAEGHIDDPGPELRKAFSADV